MSTWRYVQNGQPAGPVDTPALEAWIANGTLSPDTLVWKEGMAEWAAARTLPEFASVTPRISGPPPIPSSQPPMIQTGDSDAVDIEKNKVFAILAYLGILFLVPLLAAPNSKFARYHANQGVVLFLASLIVGGASFILVLIPIIGCVALAVPMMVAVTHVILMVLGIINAAGGQNKPLPLIGHFQIIK
jgi:uncharacterized membrane protein